MTVTIRHLRRAGFCTRGARRWAQGHPSLSWSRFLESGYPASELEALNCPLADAVVRVARDG